MLPGMTPMPGTTGGAGGSPPPPPAPAVIAYVGTAVVSDGGGSIAWPSGTQVGDTAIIALARNEGTPVFSGSGWTTDIAAGVVTSDNIWSVYHKLALSAGDISTPPTFTATNGGYMVMVYRGVTSVTLKASLADDAGTTAVLTGFTKDALSSRILTAICDRDTSANMVPPTGFIERAEGVVSSGFDMASADFIATSYVNGATVTWTGLGSSSGQAAALFELT